MKDIAAAGYTSVQTSPVQQPKDYYWEGVAYGNVGIPNGTGGEDGNWWKLYQPVTFSICDNDHTWLGNKEEFTAMCAEAEKYGVKVIVDIVANHMGNVKGYKIGSADIVMADISPQVGEFWKPEMLTDTSYWHISTSWTHTSDGRFDVTQGNMGMPDLNTGDSKVQQMVLNLLKECIDCGADGFRFDAAKHIETPADDPSFASDFWDVVLDGARAYYKQKNGYDGVYFYGEVLNRLDDTNAENYYLSKMSITDNSTSDNLRNSVINGSVGALATSNYCSYIHGKGNRCVLWAESHDTYMGGGSSYDANDADIIKTWAIIASRKDSTGLFFARPYYSSDILANDVSKARQSTAVILDRLDGEQTQIGDVGSLTWADPAVVAVNRFRNYFVGQSERLGSSGNLAYNLRGSTGIVIVNGGGAGAVSLNVSGMTAGTYYDQISGNKFTVSGSTISGTIANKYGIAVVYNPSVDYGTVSPEPPTVLRISAATADKKTSFTTDTTKVTMTVKNAAQAFYTTSEGVSGVISGTSKEITIGSSTQPDSAVTVTITAIASDGTKKTKSFQFTKKGARSGYPTLSGPGIVFDNEAYGWSQVYCYVYYNEGTIVNAGWPGVLMTEEAGDYWIYLLPDVFDSSSTVRVIFSNGEGTQYPNGSGLAMKANEKKLFAGGTALVDLPQNVSNLAVTLAASPASFDLGGTVTLSANATGASGTVNYTFTSSDGSIIRTAGTASTCTWTPTKAGTYTVTVKAQDSASTATATAKITVNPVTEALTNTSKISAVSIPLGNTVTVTASATGGTGSYQYAVFFKKSSDSAWTTAQDYNSNTSITIKPTSMVKYDVCVKAKDSAGTIAKSYFTVKVTTSPVDTIKVSSTSIKLGETVTVTITSSSGSNKYAVYYKKTTDSNWVTAQSPGTNKVITVKPAKAATYTICVKTIDSTNTISKKYFTVKVTAPLTNTSKLSATSVNLGSTVKVNASATGGSGSYQFAVYYKKTSDSNWVTAQDKSTNATVTITPKKAASYEVCVKAIDSAGTAAKTYLSFTVTNALTNTSKISAVSVNLGKSVKVTASATGGSGSYQYAVYYKKTSDSSWVTAQNASTNRTVTITPKKIASYEVCVKAIDSEGTVAKKYLTFKAVAA